MKYYYIFSVERDSKDNVKLGYGPVEYDETMKYDLIGASDTMESSKMLPNKVSLDEAFEINGGEETKEKMKEIEDVIVKGMCEEHSLYTLNFNKKKNNEDIENFIKECNNDKEKMKQLNDCFMKQ
jgi:hypothetical protein